MRSYEFITEGRLGDISTPDFKIFVSSHLIDQVVKRGLPILGPDKVIRKLQAIKDKISQLDDGQKFWVYDASIDMSLGMRKMNDANLILATAVS